MINRIRKSRLTKFVSVFLLISMVNQLVFPAVAYALTGGPSQPEVQSFAPIGTTEMVDAFTGNFSYNIPLMEVGGYPLNLIYNSGIAMDQEASWVGLGWNINPGVINRDVRGLPDDYRGEGITKEFNMKASQTYGGSAAFSGELTGTPLKISVGLGVNYNTYNGLSSQTTANISVSAGAGASGKLTGGLGITSGNDGLSLRPSVSYDAQIFKNETTDQSLRGGVGISTSFNSRAGLKALELNTNAYTKYVEPKPEQNTEESAEEESAPEEGGKKTNTTDQDNNAVEKKPSYMPSTSIPSLASSISFGAPTYVPQPSLPLKATAVTLSIKGGATAFTIDGTGNIAGNFSDMSLRQKQITSPAFGYLYAEAATAGDNVLMDFNREKDMPYTINTPVMPLTNFTYDVYNVTGQGIGGTYRPFRNDIGTVYDPTSATTSDSYSLGIELAGGNLAHAGVDGNTVDVKTTTTKWVADNDAMGKLTFRPNNYPGEAIYEPYYFKQVGEKSVETSKLFDNFGGTDPVRVGTIRDGTVLRAEDKMYKNTDGIFGTPSTSIPVNYRRNADMDQNLQDFSSNNKKNSRAKRKQLMSILTYEDEDFVVDKALLPAKPNDIGDQSIAQVTITRADGTRYVYGLPLYNLDQREVSFNVSGRTTYCDDGLVSYIPGVDNTIENKRGRDGYFNRVNMPSYAHSYLLTAILSADYVDIGLDGPDDKDLGTYTKFTYDSWGTHEWRVPYEENRASYSEGLRYRSGNDGDDRGSYMYGKKQIRYLKTIETKNYIADFEVDEDGRLDGRGVKGENGGIPTGSGSTVTKLDRIRLFSRPDFIANGGNATPIKTVDFVYDYTLCQGIPNTTGTSGNNDHGKLTLKEVKFSYGNSQKAALSPYKFTYPAYQTLSNPDYDSKAFDRWGNYKPKTGDGSSCNSNPQSSSGPTNAHFPYVDQSDPNLDSYAAAWNLSAIQLPSGGKIKISYEADDYAYVQDKRAMQMFKVKGIGSTSAPSSGGDKLMENNNGSVGNRNRFLYFDLPLDYQINGGLSYNDANLEFKRQYFKDMPYLYFRFLVNLTKSGGSPPHYEYVTGYVKNDLEELDYGLITPSSGDYTEAYIELKDVEEVINLNTKYFHPICMAAWQFARTEAPQLAWDQPSISDNGPEAIIKSLVSTSILKNVKEMYQGPNGALEAKNYGKEVDLDFSMIRLNNPKFAKVGGGHRVKKIELEDGWNTMAGLTTSTYGQEYDYSMIEDGHTISSGVASYEPLIGKDENPWQTPIAYGNQDEKILIPDDKHYVDGPLGETFFPAPVVGYRQVTIRSLDVTNVSRTATGKIVHQFWTAYDFPVIVKRTELWPIKHKTDPIIKIFKFSNQDFVAVSQGYSIELNDMHGKPKGQFVYAEGKDGDEYISGVQYSYKTNTANNKQLDNNVKVITPQGTITNADVGLEIDLVGDSRQQTTVMSSYGLMGNLGTFLAAIIPIPIPTIFPSYSREKTMFRSSVLTKVVRRYGMLEETVAFDQGSRVKTNYLAYDSETGDVLLTRTTNEFDDPNYVFNLPAHWAYERMGGAYQNDGMEYQSAYSLGSSGEFWLGNIDHNEYFNVGDEVVLTDKNNPSDRTKVWVRSVNNGWVIFQRYDGTLFNENNPPKWFKAKVIRSGRRNLQSASMGDIASRSVPMNLTSLPNQLPDNYNDVLSAKAIIYKDDWPEKCECKNLFNSANAYVVGKSGNWRKYEEYVYLVDRGQQRINENTNIRTDGTYEKFDAFWLTSPSSDWGGQSGKWTLTSKITKYSPYGPELENEDPLENFAAANFGFNQTLPTAVASNAMYREIGFDGFEDYGYQSDTKCLDDHFSFRLSAGGLTGGSEVSPDVYHTGRHSIKLVPGDQVVMTKLLVANDCPENP